MKILPVMVLACFITCLLSGPSTFAAAQVSVKLPQPSLTGDTSVEKAIAERRSVRSYKNEPLQLKEIGQILWAAQGITEPSRGLRSAPSPRGAYLLKLYLVAGNVNDLPQGLYRYEPKGHDLTRLAEGDQKRVLYEAAGQGPINSAAAALVITADPAKSSNPSWAYLEAGHAAENVYLQCVALKVGTVTMAGFKPDQVRKALSLPEREEVIYVMPLGRR